MENERVYTPKFYTDDELKGKSGIYQIRNLINGKLYIGSSNNLYSRKIYGHRNALKQNRHENSKLQNAFNKYSEENFIFEVIEFCEPEVRYEVEQYWLNRFYNKKTCYNINSVAGKPPSSLGKHHTEETKRKLSKILKNKKRSLETCKKLSKIFKERFKDPKNNPMYGKHHSNETKKKISNINMGNKYCLGRKLSEETKQKIGSKNSIAVICLETKIIYPSVRIAEQSTKSAKIGNCCKGNQKTTNRLHWMYYKDYINATQEEIEEKLKPVLLNQHNAVSVVCLETGCKYNSISNASKTLKINSSSISNVCKNKQKTAGNLHWMFYSDYLTLTPQQIQEKLNT